MEKLVFDYTSCSFHDCYHWNIPFEYESKEKFVFDVIDDVNILFVVLGIDVDMYEDYVLNIDSYIYTLEEWFYKNKV